MVYTQFLLTRETINMSVKKVKGDLFKSKAGIIAHGCNCQGAMGSGIASQVRKKYPHVYNRYIHDAVNGDGLELGTVQFVATDDTRTQFIANCMTQENYGIIKRQVNYEAVYTCFEELRDFADKNDIDDVALPQIGAGLGGGDWHIILAILESVFYEGNGITATYHTLD